MKIIGLITARANSKRIKGKNTKKLLGHPLVLWTIKSAKNVKEINDIYVSTDDNEVIKICKKFNVKVPWKRPKQLCNSKSLSEDAVIHFLNWYEKKFGKIDGLLLLQPTSPFRKKISIEKAIKVFKKNPSKSVVSFSPVEEKTKNNLFFLNNKIKKIYKKKDISSLVKLNGSIYISSPKNLRKYKSFLKPNVVPFIQTAKEESIDIDTKEDWDFAEKNRK
jgi:CMP-N,N'-diacetyllegionaminic acid synthase